MLITEASSNDIPALVGLVNSAYRGDTSRKGWTTETDLLDGLRTDEATLREYLEDADATILKHTGPSGQVTGCVYLKREHGQMYLGMLTVSPELQAQGTGKRLLQAAEEKAWSEGYRSITITVITARHELVDWYKRKGFADTGERQPFPEDSKFGRSRIPLTFMVMQKPL